MIMGGEYRRREGPVDEEIQRCLTCKKEKCFGTCPPLSTKRTPPASVKDDVQNGMPIDGIARKYSISITSANSWVAFVCKEYGITPGKRQAQSQREKRIAEVKAMCLKGKTDDEIAAKLGITSKHVGNLRRLAGITKNKKRTSTGRVSNKPQGRPAKEE